MPKKVEKHVHIDVTILSNSNCRYTEGTYCVKLRMHTEKMCMCTCVHVHVYMCTCACAHVYMCMCTCVCVHVPVDPYP